MAGYDPLVVNDLYKKYMYGRIQDDEEENATRTSYQNALSDLQKNRRLSLMDLSVGMADRGLTHSGPALQSGLDVNARFDQGQVELGQNMASNLARIAKKRLVDDSTYNQQRSMY